MICHLLARISHHNSVSSIQQVRDRIISQLTSWMKEYASEQDETDDTHSLASRTTVNEILEDIANHHASLGIFSNLKRK